jgi:hypothetical protein
LHYIYIYEVNLSNDLDDLVLDARFFAAIRASTACWGGAVILRSGLDGLNAFWIIADSFFLVRSLLSA